MIMHIVTRTFSKEDKKKLIITSIPQFVTLFNYDVFPKIYTAIHHGIKRSSISPPAHPNSNLSHFDQTHNCCKKRKKNKTNEKYTLFSLPTIKKQRKRTNHVLY